MCAFVPIQKLDTSHGEFPGKLFRIDGAAPGDASGELRSDLRKYLVADGGPHPIGADQRQRGLLLASGAFALDDGDTLGVGGNILKLGAEPQVNVGMVRHAGQQGGLEVRSGEQSSRVRHNAG